MKAEEWSAAEADPKEPWAANVRLNKQVETLMASLARVTAECDALRVETAKAVRAEMERCAYVAKNACLVPPDGGSPTAAEIAVCDEAERRIREWFQLPAALRGTP